MSSGENCARDLVVSDFGFSGANFICGEATHESAKSKRCIIYFEILYLSLFQCGGDKLFLPVYFLFVLCWIKKGNTLETIQ